jgi:hypothetical protein
MNMQRRVTVIPIIGTISDVKFRGNMPVITYSTLKKAFDLPSLVDWILFVYSRTRQTLAARWSCQLLSANKHSAAETRMCPFSHRNTYVFRTAFSQGYNLYG